MLFLNVVLKIFIFAVKTEMELLENISKNISINQISEEIRSQILDFFMMARGAYNSQIDSKSLIRIHGQSGFICKIYDTKYGLVMAFKGTTPIIFGISMGETAIDDFYIDKILFNCKKNVNKEKISELIEEIETMINFFKNYYKNKPIILTGHSLGGAIASIVGAKNNLYTISFSAPGEKKIFKEMQFPLMDQKVYHIGLCNDSIYKGKCTNHSICNLLNYKIHTKCHLGKEFCVATPGPIGILFHTCFILEKMLRYGNELYNITNENCREEC